MDVHGGVGRAKVIRGGIGVPNDALERLLRVLEVGLPLFPRLVKLRQPFELRSFVREDFFCEEGAGCDGNKPRVRYSEAGSPGLPLRFLAMGDKFWESRVFDLTG